MLVDLVALAVLATLFAWSYLDEERAGGEWHWLVKGLLLLVGVHWGAHQGGLTGAVIFAALGNAVYARPLVIAFRRGRRIETLSLRFKGPEGAAALVEMGRELAAMRPPSVEYSVWAEHVVFAAGRALNAGYTERAAAWLETVDPSWLDRRRRAVLAQQLTSARFDLHDWKGARRALTLALRPAPGELEPILTAQEALLAALDGDARNVDTQATIALEHATGRARIIWREAHAHALAALGLREEARATLRALHAEHGDPRLRSIVGHDGPASTIAASVLNEGAPYRAGG